MEYITDTEYHARPEIGSTTAKLGIDNAPLLSLALQGRYHVADKPCFVAGRLLHMAVLEPMRFCNMVRVDGPINPRTEKPYARDTQKFQQWKDENPDVTMVERWIYDAIEAMPPSVREIFSEGTGEESHFATMHGVSAKCRTDWKRGLNFHDLKSISTQGAPIEIAIDRAIRTRAYWFSLAWYRHVLAADTGQSFAGGLIFCEKEPPHRWRIVDLDFDYLRLGDREVERVCRLIKRFNDAPPEHRARILDEDPEELYHQSACPEYLLWDELEAGD